MGMPRWRARTDVRGILGREWLRVEGVRGLRQFYR